MGITAAICTYIYGSFLVIKTALTAGITMAKNVLKLVDTVIVAVLTTITYSIGPIINTVINAIKVVQKQLVDMLLPSGDDHWWCKGFFNCLALLNELLDPNSFIFRMIKKIWKRECRSVIDDDFLNKIREWISNFDEFRKTICKYGFTFEFGISLIRDILNSFKKQIDGFVKWATKKKDELKKQLEGYLDFCINTGIVDELEKIASFFLCVFDNSDSCASVATSSSFYADSMSALGLEKQADGCYDISSEKKNSVYGSLEGMRVRCSNVKNDIDDICKSIVNPKEVAAANNAFNLSKNVFPGNMKWSDFCKEDGSFSFGKLTNPDTWKKHSIYQKCKNIKNDWNNLVARKEKGNELDFKELMNGSFMGSDGNLYYKDGCDYIKIEDSPDDEVVEMEIYLAEGAVPSNDLIVDPDTNQIISVTLAAVRINQNPDGLLAERCKTIWSFVNDWQMNADVAVHGDGVEKPI